MLVQYSQSRLGEVIPGFEIFPDFVSRGRCVLVHRVGKWDTGKLKVKLKGLSFSTKGKQWDTEKEASLGLNNSGADNKKKETNLKN